MAGKKAPAIFYDFGRKWLGILRLRPMSRRFSKVKKKQAPAVYIFIYTVRALYKDNPTFSKGPFCSYLLAVRVLFGYPFGERTEGAYEDDEDVGNTMGLLARPFMFLSW